MSKYLRFYLLIIYFGAISIIAVSFASSATAATSDLQISVSQYHKIKNSLQKIDPTTDPDQTLSLKKDQLLKINDIYNQTLASQKEKLNSFQSLDQPTKDNFSVTLQSTIDKLNSNVVTIPNIQTTDDLKNIAKALSDLWSSTQAQYGKSLGLALNTKEIEITSSLEEQLVDLQLRSTELKAANKDVSKLDAQISDSQKSLATLKQNNGLCQTKFNTITPISDPILSFQEAINCTNSSQRSVSDLWQNINLITPEIDQLSKNLKS